jgi:hypothetical protein
MTGTEMSASLLDFDLTDFYHLSSIQWLIEHLFAHAKYPHYDTMSVHVWKSAPVGVWIPRITPGSYGFCYDTYHPTPALPPQIFGILPEYLVNHTIYMVK